MAASHADSRLPLACRVPIPVVGHPVVVRKEKQPTAVLPAQEGEGEEVVCGLSDVRDGDLLEQGGAVAAAIRLPTHRRPHQVCHHRRSPSIPFADFLASPTNTSSSSVATIHAAAAAGRGRWSGKALPLRLPCLLTTSLSPALAASPTSSPSTASPSGAGHSAIILALPVVNHGPWVEIMEWRGCGEKGRKKERFGWKKKTYKD